MKDGIHVHPDGGFTCVGIAAVELYRIKALAMSIKMHRDIGMIPTRGVTITKMLAMATSYTGKAYKRGEHDKALADLAALTLSTVKQ